MNRKRWIDKQTDRHIDKQIENRQIDTATNRQTGRQTDIWIDMPIYRQRADRQMRDRQTD